MSDLFAVQLISSGRLLEWPDIPILGSKLLSNHPHILGFLSFHKNSDTGIISKALAEISEI